MTTTVSVTTVTTVTTGQCGGMMFIVSQGPVLARAADINSNNPLLHCDHLLQSLRCLKPNQAHLALIKLL